MEKKISEYKLLLSNKQFLGSVLVAAIFLTISLFINYYAATYATENISSSVTDIVLSNTRVYNLDEAFVYGSLLFFLMSVFACLNKPKSISFVVKSVSIFYVIRSVFISLTHLGPVKSVSIFYVIRSVFISLTHLGPFPSQLIINSNILNKITFGGDLFFSGHTGLPFLLALIFWKDKIIRNIFLFFSLSFAIVVLLAHLHYSIDVLSAWFITYSIYHINLFIFRKDKLQWDSK